MRAQRCSGSEETVIRLRPSCVSRCLCKQDVHVKSKCVFIYKQGVHSKIFIQGGGLKVFQITVEGLVSDRKLANKNKKKLEQSKRAIVVHMIQTKKYKTN